MSSVSSSAGLPWPHHPLRRRLAAILAVGALAVSMVATGLGLQVTTAPAAEAATCSSSNFWDVPSTNSTYYPAVTWMACNGISEGYTDGSFGVNQPVTRGEVAAFLYRQTTPSHLDNGAAYFTDVPATGRFFSTPVAWMAQGGYAKRDALTFRPNDPVTRGELAAYIYRLAGATQKGPASSPYTDMNSSTSFYDAATWLKTQKIASGYRDKTFRPTQDITRGETAIMLKNARTQLAGKGDVTTPALSPLTTPVSDSSDSATAAWKRKAADWAVAKANSSSSYYLYGGNGPNGFDCSGFIIGAFAAGGQGGLPRRAADQYKAADSYVPLSQVQVGDLVYWSNGTSVYHIAIYVGNGKIAHARNPTEGVSITSIDYSPWNMLSVAGRYS